MALSVLDQPFFPVDLDGGYAGRHAHRVPRVGQPHGQPPVLKMVGDGAGDNDAAQGHIARGDALAHGDDVRHYAPVVDAEPLAGAAKTAHDLVGDQEDAVSVAYLSDARPIVVGRDDQPVAAGDPL